MRSSCSRLDVDERIAGVAKDPEIAVDADVQARGLHELRRVRIDADSSLVDEPADRPIGEDHAAILRGSAVWSSRGVDVVPTHRPERALSRASGCGETAEASRRSARLVCILLAIALLGVGARFVGSTEAGHRSRISRPSRRRPTPGPRTLPIELRGVHVTMGLASLPGKLDEYLDLEHDGLTALELDVKDENGEVAFAPSSVPLATSSGLRATTTRRGTSRATRARARASTSSGGSWSSRTRCCPARDRISPSGASDGSVWRDSAGLGWTNPYDKRVWKYNADLAVAAARAGFDEIMFDYVRFPSDGDVGRGVFRNPGSLAKRQAVPAFLRYAHGRLEKYGVRVSAAVFGLSAARDLGIGQLPRRMAPYLDTIYAMTYPSLFGLGELGLRIPAGRPARQSLGRFASSRSRCAGRTRSSSRGCRTSASACRTGSTQVRAQIDAARVSGAKGFLLWNPECVYTDGALAAPSLDVTAQGARPPAVAARARSASGRAGGRRGGSRTRCCRDDPVAAPERRQRHVVAGEALLHLGDARVELFPAAQRPRLTRRPGRELASSRPRLPVRAPTPRRSISSTEPSIRTCRPSSHQWRTPAARGLRRSSSPFRESGS